MAMFKRRKAQGKKEILNFTIDCGIPLEDGVFELHEFTDFLRSSIKVNGKKGNLGTAVVVSENKTNTAVLVQAEAPFSKRYLKYLTKKYLRRIEIRDYIHVIASNNNRSAYELRYFKVPGDE